MTRVPWELEEAVVLLDFYLNHRKNPNIPKEKLQLLTDAFCRRAKALGIDIDEKYRNPNGLAMQLQGLNRLTNETDQSFGKVSIVFVDAYDLYQNNRVEFDRISSHFNRSYVSAFNSPI